MLTQSLHARLSHNADLQLQRIRLTLTKEHNDNTTTVHGKKVINFSSSDYLGLSQHPKIKHAFIKGIEYYGIGSGSSAIVSGFYKHQEEFEKQCADFLKRDRALLFNSGYMANLAVMSTLANRHSTIFSDKFCHASILDGIMLSQAKHYRFQHQQINHCEALLNQYATHSLLVTEGVFSMEGDLTSLNELVRLAKQYSAMFIVDDAHGIGVLGKTGGGSCEHFQLNQKDIPCLIVPMGKAFGSAGAIVAGSELLIESLIQFARSYRYTTASPPALAMAALEALNVMQTETWRRDNLQDLIGFFNQKATQHSLPLISDHPTPIRSLLFGDNATTLKLQSDLLERGFLVSCIRPPTVPKGTARIRISLNCLHQKEDITNLLEALSVCSAINK